MRNVLTTYPKDVIINISSKIKKVVKHDSKTYHSV